MSDKKKPKQIGSIRIRKTNDRGFVPVPIGEEARLAGLAHTMNVVMRHLNPSWENEGVHLTRKNILVFLVSEFKLKKIVEDQDIVWTKPDTKFVALECFPRVLVDLFRTATIADLEPATFTLIRLRR